jgi:hypothetical protein
MNIRLKNDFHNSEVSIRPRKITGGRFADLYLITRSQALRARHILCGVRECTCGGNFGERMKGCPIILENEDYERNYIVRIVEGDNG